MKVFIATLANTWKFHETSIAETHKKVAELATKLLNAFDGNRLTGLPQMLNNNHHSWSIDGNNDWWLIFNEDEPYSFEFRHRYGTAENEHVRKALTDWFAYRIGGTVVTEVER
jgi:hypothetical protein